MTSWIIYNHQTGKVVAETWIKEVPEKLNKEKYAAVTAYEWLVALNGASAFGRGVSEGLKR